MESPRGRRPAAGTTPPKTTPGAASAPAADGDAAAIATRAELGPGMLIGEYKLEAELGSGGMGRVFSASHQTITRRVAIKVLNPELTTNTDAVDRFVAEARIASELGHPNIVEVFGFGALADGRKYLMMERLKGETLRERLQRTPRLSLADALAILGTVTEPLVTAHDKGIAHCDLKPDNVFLADGKSDKPEVKLLDFGVATLASEAVDGGGTPAYFSPEQGRKEPVDSRSDVYALGVMAYEVLTGQLPFDAETTADMIAKHQNETPRTPSSINTVIPAQLDTLLKSMLEKEPSSRPTLRHVRGELAECVKLVGDATTPVPGSLPRPARGSQPRGAKPAAEKPSRKEIQTAKAKPLTRAETQKTNGSRAGVIIGVLLLAAAGVTVGVLIAMNRETTNQQPQPPTTLEAPPSAVETAPPVNEATTPAPTTFGAPVPDPSPAPGSAAISNPAPAADAAPAVAPAAANPGGSATATEPPRKRKRKRATATSETATSETGTPAPATDAAPTAPSPEPPAAPVP